MSDRELLPENEEELNQIAKRALIKAKKSPEPTGLYWLQLVRWAVESGGVGALNDHLLLFLELLESWEPETVMNFLEDGDQVDILSLVGEKEWDPMDLAYEILDYLDSQMSEKVEGYLAANRMPGRDYAAIRTKSTPDLI